jgi:hypothetical protein
MKEEILSLDFIKNNNVEEEEEIKLPKFLFKRCGNKLIVANKGCLSVIGVIYPYKSSFLIEGCESPFKKEQDAIEFLCC